MSLRNAVYAGTPPWSYVAPATRHPDQWWTRPVVVMNLKSLTSDVLLVARTVTGRCQCPFPPVAIPVFVSDELG
ncbi:MAG: hypothetical protein R2911_05580 [Caldilineaceae bacterium]